jgi:glucans biosynthesis protein
MSVAVCFCHASSAVIDRRYSRNFLRCFIFALLLVCLTNSPAASPNDKVFQEVIQRAQALAASPYQPNDMALPDVLRELNYDTYRMVTFRRERGLWYRDDTNFQAQFFHPGYLYKQPVAINEVDNGKVHPLPFSRKYFRYPRFDPAPLAQATGLGFAGFRLLYPLHRARPVDEVISFIGTSYFRALATGQTYGMSARGLAIDTAENLTEEFPAFREFWLCKPQPGERQMQFFALLDGPSVAGAYHFAIKPGADTVVEIETRIFFRKDVQVLGIAPLTSMFWRDERQPLPPNDRRPEVHDSDGLLLETAGGAQEWHPLGAVDKVTTQLFPETNPKLFGLLQRDRDPAHYRDREAKYARRPSVLVEPLGDWGAGAVRLMQLPATNEYNDNLVAFWQPQKSPAAGDAFEFKYRLHWFSKESNKR